MTTGLVCPAARLGSGMSMGVRARPAVQSRLVMDVVGSCRESGSFKGGSSDEMCLHHVIVRTVGIKA